MHAHTHICMHAYTLLHPHVHVCMLYVHMYVYVYGECDYECAHTRAPQRVVCTCVHLCEFRYCLACATRTRCWQHQQ